VTCSVRDRQTTGG